MSEALSDHPAEWDKASAVRKEGRRWRALLKKATGKRGKVRIDTDNMRFFTEGIEYKRYIFRVPFEIRKAGHSEQIEYDFAVFESLRNDMLGRIDWTVHRNWKMLSCRENREEMTACLEIAKALAKTLPPDNPEANRATEMWDQAELYQTPSG
jgi:hypothetical protein